MFFRCCQNENSIRSHSVSHLMMRISLETIHPKESEDLLNAMDAVLVSLESTLKSKIFQNNNSDANLSRVLDKYAAYMYYIFSDCVVISPFSAVTVNEGHLDKLMHNSEEDFRQIFEDICKVLHKIENDDSFGSRITSRVIQQGYGKDDDDDEFSHQQQNLIDTDLILERCVNESYFSGML